MKRLLLFLLVALLLSGCSVEQPQETTDTSTIAETEPVGLYDPGSRMERETDGAVWSYPLGAAAYREIYTMGNHLLLVGDETMTVLTGETGITSAELSIGENAPVGSVNTVVTGVGYYLPHSREVVVLNPQLQTVSIQKMPESMVSEPVICMAQNQVFYATATEIRAFDLQTGISRLIRQLYSAERVRMESHFGGAVLLCRFSDAQGKERMEYISSQTGQVVDEAQTEGLQSFWSFGEQFAAWHADGTQEQMVFGNQEDGVQSVRIPTDSDSLQTGQVPVLAMNGVVVWNQTEKGTALSFLDLETGKRTAETFLPEIQVPVAFQCDGTYIWLLASNAGADAQCLYRWDITNSVVQDDEVYTQPFFNAQNPDILKLAACRERADQLQDQYSAVEIKIWTEAEEMAGEYVVVPEYSAECIDMMLTELEQCLGQFPSGFLQETAENRKLVICLVRSMEELQTVQFWDKDACVLLITSQSDAAGSFYQSLGCAIDSHVLGNSRDFDTWDELNPEGFSYAYSNEAPEQTELLEGADRAFADRYAITYPREDRCRVFAQAMLPNNEEMFVSPIMQAKLLRLCSGIREAYGLEKSPESFPWEQYLQTSIAFTEE